MSPRTAIRIKSKLYFLSSATPPSTRAPCKRERHAPRSLRFAPLPEAWSWRLLHRFMRTSPCTCTKETVHLHGETSRPLSRRDRFPQFPCRAYQLRHCRASHAQYDQSSEEPGHYGKHHQRKDKHRGKPDCARLAGYNATNCTC